MTPHEKALRALAQAYDREDAAQRGEPDPWMLDDPGDIGDSDTWVSERLACAQVAADAFLSALLPEDTAGLVNRLREEAMRLSGRSLDHGCADSGIAANVADDAASLIQSQAARIAELKAAIRALLDCPDIADNDFMDVETHAAERAARALLNKEGRG